MTKKRCRDEYLRDVINLGNWVATCFGPLRDSKVAGRNLPEHIKVALTQWETSIVRGGRDPRDPTLCLIFNERTPTEIMALMAVADYARETLEERPDLASVEFRPVLDIFYPWESFLVVWDNPPSRGQDTRVATLQYWASLKDIDLPVRCSLRNESKEYGVLSGPMDTLTAQAKAGGKTVKHLENEHYTKKDNPTFQAARK